MLLSSLGLGCIVAVNLIQSFTIYIEQWLDGSFVKIELLYIGLM